jgi:hypothetical protein
MRKQTTTASSAITAALRKHETKRQHTRKKVATYFAFVNAQAITQDEIDAAEADAAADEEAQRRERAADDMFPDLDLDEMGEIEAEGLRIGSY